MPRLLCLLVRLSVIAACLTPPAPLLAQTDGVDPALLATREAAWRAWFAGDTATLATILPSDFVGIAWSESPFATRDETLAAATAFRESGGRLVRLVFPETRAQRFGDAVVLYGRFEVVLATPAGEQTVRGRLTETFVKRDGRWWHPAWHLDAGGVTPVPPRP